MLRELVAVKIWVWVFDADAQRAHRWGTGLRDA